jgi:hypothetical protein
MNDNLYNEVVRQFNKLLSNRGICIKKLTYCKVSKYKINVKECNKLFIVIDVSKYCKEDIFNQARHWVLYKTCTLNKAIRDRKTPITSNNDNDYSIIIKCRRGPLVQEVIEDSEEEMENKVRSVWMD